METLKGLNLHDKGSRDYTDVEYARKIIGQVF
jgi:hypothetical protein